MSGQHRDVRVVTVGAGGFAVLAVASRWWDWADTAGWVLTAALAAAVLGPLTREAVAEVLFAWEARGWAPPGPATPPTGMPVEPRPGGVERGEAAR